MMPTIQPGDRIMVNKLSFGARLYKNLRELERPKVETYRIKGLRGICYNDVVVFNFANPLAFDIGKVYVKRCIGLPGDTIWIRNGQYYNSTASDKVMLKHFAPYCPISVPDSSLFRCFPYKKKLGWTILDFGPLYIPRKDARIELTQTNIWLYRNIITYENSTDVRFVQDSVFLRNQHIQTYTFKEDYYFMAGDNFANSGDSRYFGPIPEAFIIGIAPYTLYAKNRQTGKINKNRILKRL